MIAIELAPGFSAGDPPTHDLALLRLQHAVVAPAVALASAGEVPQGGAGEVAGWGCTIPTSSCLPSTTLIETSLPIQAAGYCNDGDGTHPGYGAGLVDPTRQVCAGSYHDTAGAPDTCRGDSGGPLVARDGGVTRLVGLTSYGRPACGTAPAVYTAIGGYRDFIDPVLAQWDPLPTADGTFVPVVPYRALDTRQGQALAAGEVRPLPLANTGVPGGVPSGARAVALNLTALGPRGDGYLTVFPCDQAPPLASNANYSVGADVAASAVVGLDPSGSVCLTSFAPTDVVVDVGGYWLAAGHPIAGARYHPVLPQRMYDSRAYKDPLSPGETGALRVDLLADEPVGAVTLNITAVDPEAAGYLTVYPCDASPPLASSVNYGTGQTVANAVTVAASADERICVDSYAETDLVIDVTGWFGRPGATSGKRIAPVPPSRLIDTRDSAPIAARGTLAVPTAGRAGVPADAAGVIVNVTAVDAVDDGYLVVYPCGQPVPSTSTVNVSAGRDVPNLAFVPVAVAGGAICVFSYGSAHVVLDVYGYVTR